MKVKKARLKLKTDEYTKFYYTAEYGKTGYYGGIPAYPQILEDRRPWDMPSVYDNREARKVEYDQRNGALRIEV